MSEPTVAPRRIALSGTRLLWAILTGILAGIAVWIFAANVLAPLVGWDVLALVYLAWTWAGTWRLDAGATARLAVREDPGRPVADVLLLVASTANLVAVALVIRASGSTGLGRELRIGPR